MVGAVAGRRRVADRVPAADLTGDALAREAGRPRRSRQESLSAGSLRQRLQDARVSVGIVLVEDADGVDRRVRLAGPFEHAIEARPAGIVAAVADGDQNPSRACALIEMI